MDEITRRALDFLLGLPETTVYLAVGVLCWAEAAFFLGFITPGEVAIATGGILASQGRVSLSVLAGVATTGTILGNSTGYFLGRLWGSRLLAWAPLQRRLGPAIDRTREFMERRGEWAIVLGRFATVTRIVVPFMAGASGLPYRRFLVFDIPVVAVWASAWVILGFFLGESWDVLWEVAGHAAFLVLFLAVSALAIRWVAVRVAANQRRVEAAVRLFLRGTGLGRLAKPVTISFRWLVRRLDPRLARGLNLTLGFVVLLAAAGGAGLVLGHVQAVRGLALLDFPALEWMGDVRTDEAVAISRGFLQAFHWPGMIALAAVAAAILGWRVSGGAAAGALLGVLGGGLGALALDRLILEGVVPRAEFPAVPVAVAAALLIHAAAGAARVGGWPRGVGVAAGGVFMVCVVSVASLTAGWAAPSGIVLGFVFGLAWATALEVQAAIIRADREEDASVPPAPAPV